MTNKEQIDGIVGILSGIESISFSKISKIKKNLNNCFEKTVQEVYNTLLEKGRMLDIRNIRNATNIKPKLSEELIQKAYNRYIDGMIEHAKIYSYHIATEEYGSLIGQLYNLTKRTVELSEDQKNKIRKFYDNSSSESLPAICNQFVHYIYEATKVRANFPKDKVNEIYAQLSKYYGSSWKNVSKNLEELTGIKMPKKYK